jgi:type IX secretion system PorP/SprF family membrane protein
LPTKLKVLDQILHRGLIFCLLVVASLPLGGQDVHFSQFHNAPLMQNPALSGAFEADQRFGVNYRRQWFAVPVPYETIAGTYDQKLSKPWLGANWLGLGGSFLYDQAGDGQLSWLQLSLHGAFNVQVSEEQSFSLGMQARFGQRAVEPGQFFFGDQFTDNTFDPTSPSAEAFLNNSAGFFSLAAGANWFFAAAESRTRAWVGLAGAHLNRPSIAFLDQGKAELPLLMNFSFMGVAQFSPEMDFIFNILAQSQGPYREGLANAGVRYHLSQVKGKETALQLSGGYRLGDATILYLDVFYGNWQFGLSYDINTSPFLAATNRNGGPELSLQYVIAHVKPPKVFKACPVF